MVVTGAHLQLWGLVMGGHFQLALPQPASNRGMQKGVLQGR